jgi:hypothetical protein
MTDLGSTTAAKPRRFKLRYLVIAGVLAIAACGTLLVTTVLTVTRPVVDGADAFMGAIRDGHYDQAYARAAPSLQQELGSAEAFGAGIANYRARDWSWSQRSVSNSVGNVSGNVTWQNGNTGTAEIQLNQVNDEWRVVAFRFN